MVGRSSSMQGMKIEGRSTSERFLLILIYFRPFPASFWPDMTVLVQLSIRSSRAKKDQMKVRWVQKENSTSWWRMWRTSVKTQQSRLARSAKGAVKRSAWAEMLPYSSYMVKQGLDDFSLCRIQQEHGPCLRLDPQTAMPLFLASERSLISEVTNGEYLIMGWGLHEKAPIIREGTNM